MVRLKTISQLRLCLQGQTEETFFYKRHHTRELPQLDVNNSVFVSRDRNSDAVPGRDIQDSKHSYAIETSTEHHKFLIIGFKVCTVIAL